MVRIGCWFLLVFFVVSAHADAVSKDCKVHEMLSLMQMAETTNRLEQAQEQHMRTLTEQQLSGATLDADQKKNLEEFQGKVVELLRASNTWKALEPEVVKVYSDTYSESEIDGILAFYHSPVGQKMLSKTDELTNKAIAISQQHMTAVQPQIQKLLDDFMRNTL